MSTKISSVLLNGRGLHLLQVYYFQYGLLPNSFLLLIIVIQWHTWINGLSSKLIGSYIANICVSYAELVQEISGCFTGNID